MRVEIITPEIERARLFSETALILARLRAEADDGRLDEIASRGDELLRAAELAHGGALRFERVDSDVPKGSGANLASAGESADVLRRNVL